MSIVHFLAPNPSPLTLHGTNSYVLGIKQLVIVDPGPKIFSHLQRLIDYVHDNGETKLILLTHHHPDHVEGAEWLSQQLNVPIAAYWESPVRATQRLKDEEVLNVDTLNLVALHTPGHSHDHLSFYLPQEKTVFTGDLVLGEGTTTMINYKDYMHSLHRLKKLQASLLFPGHGPVGIKGHQIEATLNHREMRHHQILQCIREGINQPKQIVKKIYDGTPDSLLPFALGNVQAHLEALREDKRIYEEAGVWRSY